MSKLKSEDTGAPDRQFSVVSETGEVRWAQIMKKFSEANKETCKRITVDIPRMVRSLKKFPTGSEYEGSWDVMGMSGYGIYTFPHGYNCDDDCKILGGPVYEGDFQDGNFHGDGEIHYGCGTILKGKWKNGKVSDRRLIFADGLEYFSDKWKYCRMPDRRFTVEYDRGMKPAGRSYMTAMQPTQEIPEGCYDTGDGYYDPKTISIYRYGDTSTILRTPSLYEQKWIEQNCRKIPDKPVGPQLDLYEKWQEPQLEMEPVPLPSCPTLVTPNFLQEEDYDDDDTRAVFFDAPWQGSRVSKLSRCSRASNRTTRFSTSAAEHQQKCSL